MPPSPPFPTDAMPLREALRGLRHVLRRSGTSLRETLPVERLPKPAADVAVAVLREVEDVARTVDRAATDLVRRVIGADERAAPRLDAPPDPARASAFAAAAYTALQTVLERLGAGEVFISEAGLRDGYLSLGENANASQDEAARAAELMMSLLRARVVRDPPAMPEARVPPKNLTPVALFALLLWLLAPRAEDDAESVAALDAASDIAAALSSDVTAAADAHDTGRLAALFAEFADNV